MNNLLQLKGKFISKSNNSFVGPKNLPRGHKIESDKISQILSDLRKVKYYWQNKIKLDMIFLNVVHTTIIAKSRRICALFKENKKQTNDLIVGSKFQDKNKHVFTYCMKPETLDKAISVLEKCYDIVCNQFKGSVSFQTIELINKNEIVIQEMAKTQFVNLLCDCHFITSINCYFDIKKKQTSSIVSLYKTEQKRDLLLKSLDINISLNNKLDDDTYLFNEDEVNQIIEKAPFLISTSSFHLKDMDTIKKDSLINNNILNKNNTNFIKLPSNEPIIGVIDTCFNANVYFSKWVDKFDCIENDFSSTHGTEVASIIVDGPNLNPSLDDGCGNFRVRHFGITNEKKIDTFFFVKKVREIISKNRDVKVWNISLGSECEIDENTISYEAAELDNIQTEYDVIFIIAGTNDENTTYNKRIGIPADSLNSLVVNSVNSLNEVASYSRKGPVLNFFFKPDVSYYGGDKEKKIIANSEMGNVEVVGTSYAAPWISRKIAYLIHKLGFSREIAKALIIDSAAGWNRMDNLQCFYGYGVVPINIANVVECENDEIRFVLTGSSQEYETYNYNIPVPCEKDKHPFFARATMCYFPTCSRNQGVDYSNTEMDIHFGRIAETKKGPVIKSIDNNVQDDKGSYVYEDEARKFYRKWDNVKHIAEELKDKAIPKKRYETGLWGLSIKSKERLKKRGDFDYLNFGVVVTLKEMKGKNRVDEFIKQCILRGWIVNEISINEQIDIYNKTNEEISWE